jgi:hypothetical protein
MLAFNLILHVFTHSVFFIIAITRNLPRELQSFQHGCRIILNSFEKELKLKKIIAIEFPA